MIRTTFFTSATTPYWPFILPYATSVLAHNPDALVEVAVEDIDDFVKTACTGIAALESQFPDQFHVRGGQFDIIHSAAVRFLETPERMSQYTYIGDIDILVLEGGITDGHLRHMEQTGLPYSNLVRAVRDRRRMSGLHFTRSDAYYPVRLPPEANELNNDEEILLAMIESRGIGLPPDDHPYRPVHGLHLSLNRRPYDLNRPHWGLHRGWIIKYVDLCSTLAWQQVAVHFDPLYQMLLFVMEAAAQVQNPDLDIYRYAAARKLWLNEAENRRTPKSHGVPA